MAFPEPRNRPAGRDVLVPMFDLWGEEEAEVEKKTLHVNSLPIAPANAII